MSVILATEENKYVLICKGAVEEVFAACTQFAMDGAVAPLDTSHLVQMQGQTRRLNADGFRVIAAAYKEIADPRSSYRNEDERDLTLPAGHGPPRRRIRPKHGAVAAGVGDTRHAGSEPSGRAAGGIPDAAP